VLHISGSLWEGSPSSQSPPGGTVSDTTKIEQIVHRQWRLIVWGDLICANIVLCEELPFRRSHQIAEESFHCEVRREEMSLWNFWAPTISQREFKKLIVGVRTNYRKWHSLSEHITSRSFLPNLHRHELLYIGAVQDTLDNYGYFSPGVGDIGDRLFGI